MINTHNKQTPKDKLPPRNTDAEESVLGSIVIDNDAIGKIADVLFPEDFYETKNRHIYEAVLDLYQKNEPIDVLSLSSRLKEKHLLKDIGGITYLSSLIEKTPTSAHINHYANLVHQKKVRRDLIAASYRIAELGWSESEDVNNILDKSEQTIFSISQKSIAHDFVSLKDALAEAFNRMDQMQKGGNKL